MSLKTPVGSGSGIKKIKKIRIRIRNPVSSDNHLKKTLKLCCTMYTVQMYSAIQYTDIPCTWEPFLYSVQLCSSLLHMEELTFQCTMYCSLLLALTCNVPLLLYLCNLDCTLYSCILLVCFLCNLSCTEPWRHCLNTILSASVDWLHYTSPSGQKWRHKAWKTKQFQQNKLLG